MGTGKEPRAICLKDITDQFLWLACAKWSYKQIVPKQVDFVIMIMQTVYDAYFLLCVFTEKYPQLNLFYSFFRLSAQAMKVFSILVEIKRNASSCPVNVGSLSFFFVQLVYKLDFRHSVYLPFTYPILHLNGMSDWFFFLFPHLIPT